MATKWRAFKTDLTRDWINKFKDKPVLLKDPPPKYKKFIDEPTWDKFVKERLSEDFKVKFKTIMNVCKLELCFIKLILFLISSLRFVIIRF